MMDAAQTGARSLAALRAKNRLGTLGRLEAAVMAELDPLWAMSAADRAWAEGLLALDVFIAREGHSVIPLGHLEGDAALGLWASSCRRDFNAGRLTDARAAELLSRPLWVWSVFGDSFARSLGALDLFIARAGHSAVPHDHVEADIPLGKWCGWQRSAYAAGTLPALREDALNARPEWSWEHDVT